MTKSLGDRMKSHYEARTRYFLPRRTNTVIRVDGKAFKNFTKRFKSPFDDNFISAMNHAAIELCKEAQGAKFGFVQSDEISVVLTDYERIQTDAWFDGNLAKIISIAATTVSVAFNTKVEELTGEKSQARFDARAFTIPDKEEVINYFIYRQQDATRNSIQMVARSLYSHKELNNKDQPAMQELIFQKGQNWNDYPTRVKRGGAIVYNEQWEAIAPPIFTQDRDFIKSLLPEPEYT